MNTITIIVGLVTAVFGGGIVVLFDKWIDYRHELHARVPSGSTPPHPFRTNLPNRDYVEFIGREEELKIGLRVLGPEHRIGVITIDGIGGIGKTTLALELAHRCRARNMFDAIVWLSGKRTVLTSEGIVTRTQSFTDIDSLRAVVASVLNRPELTNPGTQERMLALHRCLGQERVLLVLDNLETIDDERILDFLRELPVPSKAIVTTRHRISVAYDIRLSGMALTESMVLMRQECQKKAIQVDNDDLRILFRRTGGIPLAMVWSISQIATKGRTLAAVLSGLGQAHSDICQFCFRASANLLDRHEWKTLLSFAAFEGPMDRETIGLVAGFGQDVISRDEALAKLVQLSLVSQHGDMFDMLTLARNYVRAELDSLPLIDQDIRERWVRHHVAREGTLVPVTIYFPIHIPGQAQSYIRAMIDRFNGLGLGAYALAIFPGDYSQTSEVLRQAIREGTVPDIVILDIALWLEMVAQDAFLALDGTVLPGALEYLVQQGFEEAFLSNISYKGRIFGIPFNRSLPVVFCNRDLLRAVGIDSRENPITWDALRAYAEQSLHGASAVHGAGFFPLSMSVEDWFYACFVRQAGGCMLDAEGLLPAFDSTEAALALNYWQDLQNSGLLKPDVTWFQVPQDFIREQCAMIYHSSASLDFLVSTADFELDVWPLPYLARPAVEIGGANFAILANRPREQQEAAWRFINWFTEPEQTAEWALKTGYLPVRTAAFELPRYSNYVKSVHGADVAAAQRPCAYPRASAPYFSQLKPLMIRAISDVLKGIQTNGEALAMLQEFAIKNR